MFSRAKEAADFMPHKAKEAADFILINKPSIMAFLETKIKSRNLSKMVSRVWIQVYFLTNNNEAFEGRILVLWDGDQFEIKQLMALIIYSHVGVSASLQMKISYSQWSMLET